MPTITIPADDPAKTAAILCKKLLPLAMQLVDDLPVEERLRFRELAGQYTIFDLMHAISWLQSERSLQNAVESGAKKKR